MTDKITGFSDELDNFHTNFLEFEKRLDLFDWEVRGIPLWERLRTSVYRSALRSTEIYKKKYSAPDKNIINTLRGSYLWARNIFLRNPLFGNKNDILVWGHQRRKQLDDDNWWDIYTDPLFEVVDIDYQQVETSHRLTHHRPAKTTNLDYLDLITYSSTIYRKIFRNDGRLKSKIIDDIEAQLANEFNVEIDVGRLAYEKLTDRKVYLPLYQRLLRRVSPEIAFTVVGYSKETFIEACKREEVPVVELQHGMIGNYHIGYTFPQGIEKIYKPDYLFSFGPYWTNSVSMFDNERIFNVGYKHLEEEYEKYNTVQQVDELLFISQDNHGRELSQLATNLAMKESHNINVVYKLHPKEYSYWEEEYPWLTESEVDVVKDDINLHELQARARAQVGVFSTALFEGFRFGTSTVLIENNGICRMKPIISDYGIPVVSNADELLEVVLSLDNQQVNHRMFFSENPSDKFEEAIETICNK